MANRTGTALLLVLLAFAAASVAILPGTCASRVRKGAAAEATRRELRSFASRLQYYGVVQRALPGPTLQDAVEALLGAREIAPAVRSYCRMLIDNRDAWGNRFIYERKDNRRLAVIRSLGPNGRDESGKGDDLQQVVDITWLEEEP